MIGKGKLVNNSLPKHFFLNDRIIFDQKTIANSFHECFINFGPKLVSEIPQLQRSFEMYLKGFDSSFEEVNLTDEEIKTAFFCLKGGKSPGFHEINYDIVKQKFNSLLASLKCIFDVSLKSFFFSIWVFFHEYSRITGLQGKGISLTPHHQLNSNPEPFSS